MADPAAALLSQGRRRRHALLRLPFAGAAGAAAAAAAAAFRRLRCLHGNLISASVRFARCPFRLVASLVGLQSGTNSRPQTLGIPACTARCQVPAGHALSSCGSSHPGKQWLVLLASLVCVTAPTSPYSEGQFQRACPTTRVPQKQHFGA